MQMVNELLNILEKENNIYEDILKISKNKTRIIVEGKVTDLESVVKYEQSLVLQMGRLETARDEMVGNISKELNIKNSDITISELLKYVKGEQNSKLKLYQDNMSNIISELKSANELNSKLIKNSLEFIDFSMNIISNVYTGVNSYGNSGKTSDTKKRSFFDVKL
jgi:flagellar biosynthesis/type III secretory pathway chaperone